MSMKSLVLSLDEDQYKRIAEIAEAQASRAVTANHFRRARRAAEKALNLSPEETRYARSLRALCSVPARPPEYWTPKDVTRYQEERLEMRRKEVRRVLSEIDASESNVMKRKPSVLSVLRELVAYGLANMEVKLPEGAPLDMRKFEVNVPPVSCGAAGPFVSEIRSNEAERQRRVEARSAKGGKA